MRAARTATALLCTAALAAGAAGCGGSEVEYQEVPGPPVEVAAPSETVDAAAGGDAPPTPTPTATTEPGATAPSDQSGSAGEPSADTGTSPDAAGTDSGGATAPAQEDSAANDTAPPAGSEAQQFEDFCAQNPGAC